MYAVIMAGGGGTRLWPLSRSRRPKPFLPLLEGGGSLLAATIDRLAPLVGPADIHVVTDARHAPLVREVAPELPAANLLAEPEGRNTAAAIALAAHLIDRPADEVMLVLPADQAITDVVTFQAALRTAAARAASGDMVTLGVEPTGPATGYGYVVPGGAAERYGERDTFRVERFEEKPRPDRAASLVAAGAAWNAGIFVWQRRTLLEGLERYAPAIDGPIAGWAARRGGPSTEAPSPWPGDAIEEVYRSLPALSIDYALLEPASLDGRVAVVPAAMGWSDLGSWSALLEQRSGRDDSPVLSTEGPARVIEVGGQRVLVHAAGGRLVAVVGLADVVVVDTPDALLVTSSGSAQDVRQVVDRLRDEGLADLL